MAINKIQKGNTLVVTAPANVSSGDGVLVGGIFGVAIKDGLTGEVIAIDRTGVWNLPKTSAQAWSVGDAINWDDTGKVATTAVGDKAIGYAVASAANPSSTGLVLLTGS